jgi:hypothetical protein
MLVRFQTRISAYVRVTVSQDVAQCSLVEVYRRFGGDYCLRHQEGGRNFQRYFSCNDARAFLRAFVFAQKRAQKCEIGKKSRRDKCLLWGGMETVRSLLCQRRGRMLQEHSVSQGRLELWSVKPREKYWQPSLLDCSTFFLVFHLHYLQFILMLIA